MKKSVRIILIITGAVVLLALINFAPMVSYKMPGMKKFLYHGITVFAKPGDQPEAQRIAARIARQSSAVSKDYRLGGCNSPPLVYRRQYP